MRGSDIIQGITAFSAMSKALQGDPHKDMYSYLMRRQQMMDKAYKEAYARGAAGQPMGYPSAGGMTANGGGALTTGLGGAGTPGYLQGDGSDYGPDVSGTYSEGGKVPAGDWKRHVDEMVRRASIPDTSRIDRALVDQNNILSPPGAPTGVERAYAEGGMVPHFQGGGIEAINTAGEPQPDPLFDTVNQAAPPPEDPRWSPQGDIASANAIDEVRRRRAALTIARDVGAGVGASMPAPTSRYGASEVEYPNPLPPDWKPHDFSDSKPSPSPTKRYGASEVEYPNPLPPDWKSRDRGDSEPSLAAIDTTSKFGRATKGVRDLAKEAKDWVEQKNKLANRINALDPGVFQQTTEAERSALEELRRQAIKTSPSVSQGAAPPGAPAAGAPSVATPAPNAGRPGTAPNAGLPGSQDIRGIDRFLQPSSVPNVDPDFRGAAAAPVGPAAPAARTSTGVSPQAAAGAGTNTPGGIAAAPVPSPVPGAAAGGQSRVTAFDPATEQGIGAVDAQGRDIRGQKPQMLQAQAPQPNATNAAAADSERPGNLSSNKVMDDFKTALDGAHKGALMSMQQKGLTPQQVQSGVGAASPRATNAILHRFGGDGRLTPGEAMVAGMTHVYAKALEMGDVAKANQMAFAIVQRANLEASVNGKAAIAALKGGDLKKGTEMMIRGHDWLPDGVRINMAPDGKSVIATDLEGKHQQLPLDGRWVMQAAMGLQDGSAMWNMINQHAAMVAQGAKGADRDAAGRALRNQKTGLEIERLKRKMAAPTGGGSAAPSVMSRIQEALSGKPAATPQTIHVNVDRDE